MVGIAVTAATTLLPILIKYGPDLVKWVAGDKAGTIASQVTNVIASITGTDNPDDAQAKLDADPQLQLTLRLRLAELAANKEIADRNAQRDEFMAALEDVKSARQQTVDLTKYDSAIAWGAPIISVLITITFGGVLYMMIAKPMSLTEAQSAIINILVGTLGTMFTAVGNYWLGSSAGSVRKDQVISQATGVQNDLAKRVLTPGS